MTTRAPDYTSTDPITLPVGPVLLLVDASILTLRTLDQTLPLPPQEETERRRLADVVRLVGLCAGIPAERLERLAAIHLYGGPLGPVGATVPWERRS